MEISVNPTAKINTKSKIYIDIVESKPNSQENKWMHSIYGKWMQQKEN